MKRYYSTMIALVMIGMFSCWVSVARATQNYTVDGSLITEDIALNDTDIKPIKDQNNTTVLSLNSSLSASGLNVDRFYDGLDWNNGYKYQILIGKIAGYPDDINTTNIDQVCKKIQAGKEYNSGFFTSYGDGKYDIPTIGGDFFVNEINPPAIISIDKDPGDYKLVAFLFRYSKDLAKEPSLPYRCDRVIAFSITDFSGAGTPLPPTDTPNPTPTAPVNHSEDYGVTTAEPPSTTTTPTVGDNLNTIDQVGSYSNKASFLCQEIRLAIPSGTNSNGAVSTLATGISGVCDTRPMLMNAISILLVLSGVFFVISIIYSGLMLIQATSDDLATKAKRNLIWSATGATIIVLANWIVPFVIKVIAQKSG